MTGRDDPTRTAGKEEPDRRDATQPERDLPSAGDRLGRYVLRDVIGRGGMGIVFRARDPQLGRDIAIKVVLARSRTPDTTDRLLDEARTMARLRHPHVLPVFDVGATAHGVFMAMPLIEGGTLKDWLRQQPRTWMAVAAVFLAAGRGLEAAHAAGLVHRDFKPTNVLMEPEGGVLVADFGIASTTSEEAPESHDKTSSIVGTPAYMAPEQARGEPVDSRADQFSYCVSFWEALYGERPDAGDTATRDHRSEGSDERSLAAKDGSGVPLWLRRALLRGLSFEPQRRWGSMGKLLAEIERRKQPPSRRLPWIAIAGGTAAIFAIAIGVMLPRRPSARRQVVALPALALSEPRQITDLKGCTENPVFVSPTLVSYDFAQGKPVDLYAIDVRTLETTRLTEGDQWMWRSQPGRTPGEIVYLGTNRRDVAESYVATLDIATRKETSRFSAVAGGVSAVGDAIFYADINGLSLRQRIGTEDKVVRNYPPSTIATFSIEPTTMRVAYVGVRGGPLCHHLLSSGTQTCSNFKVRTHAPAFSPRADAVYAGSEEGVHRLDLKTNDESTVLGADASGGVAVSPDGKTLVFSSCRARGKIVKITLSTDTQTAPETVVIDDNRARSPALGPAGRIAWIRLVAGTRVLVFRDPEGRERDVTSASLGDVRDPSFDPSGTRLTFAAAGDKPGVYVADVSSSPPVITRFTTDSGDREPVWFSDAAIAFERRGNNGISSTHVIDVASGNVRELIGPSNVCLTSNLATGELLVVSHTDSGKGIWWLDPISGKRRRAITGGPSAVSSAAVSRNGEWLLIEGGAAGSKWRARLPEGALTLVHEETGSRTSIESAITDSGDIIAAPQEWEGELFMATVRAGSL